MPPTGGDFEADMRAAIADGEEAVRLNRVIERKLRDMMESLRQIREMLEEP